MNVKNIITIILCLTFVSTLCACGGNNSKENSADFNSGNTASMSQLPNNSELEIVSDEGEGQGRLDEFFVMIGTNVNRADIDDIAKGMGLYINHKNSGTGNYIYKVAADKDVANMNRTQKGSYVTVSFNALNNDAITEITYFDMERMISGYWNPDAGYLLANYNYPQIVYINEDTNVIQSRIPVGNAKEIIDYSVDREIGENLLDTLFASITLETTKDDLMTFVNEHGLSYNSRGAGNEQVIAYCREIGDKYGENGSYITFSTGENDLVSVVTYYYYPANYRNEYRAIFYSNSYATAHSVPSGFVLESQDSLTEYSTAKELLEQLYH